MKYISGLHALNIPCSLETTGDWHTYSQRWENVPLWESGASPFGTEGIETHDALLGKPGTFHVANHIRACLDMLQAGDFSNLQGMRRDYICTEKYDARIFQDILRMQALPNWQAIDRFMEKEYMMKWLRFRKKHRLPKPYVQQGNRALRHKNIESIEIRTADRLCQLAICAYQGRDKLRDLYDICFLCNTYFDKLEDATKNRLRDALIYKGFEHFDYIVSTQEDPLVDKDALAKNYLEMYDKLGLLYSDEEVRSLPRDAQEAEQEEAWSR